MPRTRLSACEFEVLVRYSLTGGLASIAREHQRPRLLEQIARRSNEPNRAFQVLNDVLDEAARQELKDEELSDERLQDMQVGLLDHDPLKRLVSLGMVVEVADDDQIPNFAEMVEDDVRQKIYEAIPQELLTVVDIDLASMTPYELFIRACDIVEGAYDSYYLRESDITTSPVQASSPMPGPGAPTPQLNPPTLGNPSPEPQSPALPTPELGRGQSGVFVSVTSPTDPAWAGPYAEQASSSQGHWATGGLAPTSNAFRGTRDCPSSPTWDEWMQMGAPTPLESGRDHHQPPYGATPGPTNADLSAFSLPAFGNWVNWDEMAVEAAWMRVNTIQQDAMGINKDCYRCGRLFHDDRICEEITTCTGDDIEAVFFKDEDGNTTGIYIDGERLCLDYVYHYCVDPSCEGGKHACSLCGGQHQPNSCRRYLQSLVW